MWDVWFCTRFDQSLHGYQEVNHVNSWFPLVFLGFHYVYIWFTLIYTFPRQKFPKFTVFSLNERDFSHGLYNRFITLPPQPGTQIGQLIVSGQVRD